MTDLTYTIEIRIDESEVDSDTRELIAASASSHDTDGGLRRFLGDHMSEAEDGLNSLLPEGFWVKIKEES